MRGPGLWIIGLLAALAINLLIFLIIPLLTQPTESLVPPEPHGAVSLGPAFPLPSELNVPESREEEQEQVEQPRPEPTPQATPEPTPTPAPEPEPEAQPTPKREPAPTPELEPPPAPTPAPKLAPPPPPKEEKPQPTKPKAPENPEPEPPASPVSPMASAEPTSQEAARESASSASASTESSPQPDQRPRQIDGGYEVGDVDSPPRIRSAGQPEYPYKARRRGVEGRVVVRLLVSAEGRVERADIVSADPPGVFEDAVLRAVRRWRFEPGRVAEEPVPTWVLVPLRFDLSS